MSKRLRISRDRLIIVMRRRWKLVIPLVGVLAILMVVGLWWLNRPQVTVTGHLTATTISARQLKQDHSSALAAVQSDDIGQAWYQHQFLLLDIRPRSEYLASHIKGAVSFPLAQMADGSLHTIDTIIIYSSDETDIAKALTILNTMGVTHIYTLHDSLKNLEQAGYQMEKS